jgi:hypothetical protein
MALDPRKFAQEMGAVHLGTLPDVGSGPFGAAHLAKILKTRLEGNRQHPDNEEMENPQKEFDANN